MNELHCAKCDKIIGFVNKIFYANAKRKPTVIKCIDCYFTYLNELVKE